MKFSDYTEQVIEIYQSLPGEKRLSFLKEKQREAESYLGLLCALVENEEANEYSRDFKRKYGFEILPDK